MWPAGRTLLTSGLESQWHVKIFQRCTDLDGCHTGDFAICSNGLCHAKNGEFSHSWACRSLNHHFMDIQYWYIFAYKIIDWIVTSLNDLWCLLMQWSSFLGTLQWKSYSWKPMGNPLCEPSCPWPARRPPLVSSMSSWKSEKIQQWWNMKMYKVSVND